MDRPEPSLVSAHERTGRRDFLAAEGVVDWVELHGGAAAVFRVPTLVDAARLADAIAQDPAVAGSGVLMTVADDRLTVRLTRGVFRLEAAHIDLARQISATARQHGAVPERAAVQEVRVAVAAKPDQIGVAFWRAVLGYAPLAEVNAVDPLGHGSTVWMQDLNPYRPLRHAMHVDASVAREQAEARDRVVDDTDASAGWIMADQAGNRVCVAAWPDGSAPPG